MASQQISGLASGLDTASIVEQLMAVERRPLVRLTQKASVEEARQSALSAIQSKLKALSLAASDLKAYSAWADTQTVESSNPSAVAVARTGGAAAGGYQLWVLSLARADQVVATHASDFTAAADDRLSISVGGGTAVEVAIAAGDDVAKIAEKINGSSNVPVYAGVVGGKLVLSGKTTGAAATIDVTSTGTLRDDLFGAGALAHTSADARISLTGADDPAPLTRSSNVVDDLFPGVKLTLKAAGPDPTTVVVGAPAPDTGTVQAKVKAFVDAYNAARDLISSKVNEKRVANPQTDADRAKGVLSGDPGLSALLSHLRATISVSMGDRPETMRLLSQAGISTGKSSASGTLDPDAVAGRLTLDEATLATALEGGLEDVKALVAGSGGLVERLEALVDPWISGDGTNAAILDSRLEISRAAVTANRREQDAVELRLGAYQKRLEAQFTALEKALQSSQSQGQWLSGQLSALLG